MTQGAVCIIEDVHPQARHELICIPNSSLCFHSRIELLFPDRVIFMLRQLKEMHPYRFTLYIYLLFVYVDVKQENHIFFFFTTCGDAVTNLAVNLVKCLLTRAGEKILLTFSMTFA